MAGRAALHVGAFVLFTLRLGGCLKERLTWSPDGRHAIATYTYFDAAGTPQWWVIDGRTARRRATITGRLDFDAAETQHRHVDRQLQVQTAGRDAGLPEALEEDEDDEQRPVELRANEGADCCTDAEVDEGHRHGHAEREQTRAHHPEHAVGREQIARGTVALDSTFRDLRGNPRTVGVACAIARCVNASSAAEAGGVGAGAGGLPTHH